MTCLNCAKILPDVPSGSCHKFVKHILHNVPVMICSENRDLLHVYIHRHYASPDCLADGQHTCSIFAKFMKIHAWHIDVFF